MKMCQRLEMISVSKQLDMQVKRQFARGSGFARTKELAAAGFSSAFIARLAREGDIVRVKRGLYRWHQGESPGSLIEACRIVPGGVVCLLSALSVYEVGTKVPREIHLAIPRKARTPLLPLYPPIRLAYFSDLQYQIGITAVKYNGVDVPIYDLEKTICDCARYRNKIGYDVFREAVTEYLRQPGRNIDKLLDYAQKLRVWSIIHPAVLAMA